MKKKYNKKETLDETYEIDYDLFTVEEIIKIIQFYQLMGQYKNNKVSKQKIKEAYLEYKNDLESQDVYDEEDSLDFDTYFNIIRNKDDNEKVDYSIVIDKPEINMYNVKALLVHDYMNEDAFPSVGIFDDPVTLRKDSADKIKLNGTINTTADTGNINFKLYLEYTDDNGEENKIYYEVKRG